MSKRRLLVVLMAVAVAFFVSSCGGEESNNETQDGEEAQRIISLNPSATEILVEIGAGENLVAVDAFSDYPLESLPEDTSFDAFEVDLEKMISLEPDLVVMGVEDPTVAQALGSNEIEYLVQTIPKSLDEVYANIADLGVATSQEDNAAELNSTLRSAITEASETATSNSGLRVYHEVAGDNSGYYAASSETFWGDIYTELGIENIATAETLENNAISVETIIEKDPNVIVISGDQTKKDELIKELSDRPGWSDVAAVKQERIIVVDASESGRSGPRLVNPVADIVDALATLPAPAAG